MSIIATRDLHFLKSLAKYSALALKTFWQEMSTSKVKKEKKERQENVNSLLSEGKLKQLLSI